MSLLDRMISRAVSPRPGSMGQSPESGIFEIEAAPAPEVGPVVSTPGSLPAGPERFWEPTSLNQEEPTVDVTSTIAAEAPPDTGRSKNSESVLGPIAATPEPTVRVAATDVASVAQLQPEPGDGQPVIGRPITVTVASEGMSPGSGPGTTPSVWSEASETGSQPPALSEDATRFGEEPATARPLRRHSPVSVESDRPIRSESTTMHSRHADIPIDDPTHVSVTIGRIEVTAPPPQQPAAPPAPTTADPVHLTLREYMARRRPYEQ